MNTVKEPLYKKGDVVISPIGKGTIEAVWINNLSGIYLFDDNGKELEETCYAVRYAPDSWQWFKHSEVGRVENGQ